MRELPIRFDDYNRASQKHRTVWQISYFRFFLVLFIVIVVVASSGLIGHEAGHAVKASGRSNSKTITYQPNVLILEQEEGKAALKAVSSDGSTLIFESKNPRILSLKVGDILLVKGMLAKKIFAVDVKGSQVAVLTGAAALGEAIRQANIQFDSPIHFTQSARAQLIQPESDPKQIAPRGTRTSYAQSPASQVRQKAEKQDQKEAAANLAKDVVKGVFDGWETTFSATPVGGRLNISIKLTRDIGGFRAIVSGDGYLADFDLSSSIDVNEGIVNRLSVLNKKLNGVMNFKWEVAKDTPGAEIGDYRIKLPAAISIPLYQYLDGFPLFLEISAAVIVRPAISGGKEYSRGAFRITYDGYQSFQAREGNIDSSGRVTGDIQFVESQNISALAPMGIVVAFAAPRIELSFGVSKILKFDQLEKAAKAADAIADQLMKRVLNNEDYERFKSSPLNFKISKAVENAVKSDAAAYIEMVASSGMSHTGFSAIFPCTRTDLHFIVKVGASAQAFGQQLGEVESEIFKKDFTRVDPPGTRQCEEVGN